MRTLVRIGLPLCLVVTAACAGELARMQDSTAPTTDVGAVADHKEDTPMGWKDSIRLELATADAGPSHPPQGVWKSAPPLPKRVDHIPGFAAGSCLYVLTDGSKKAYRGCQKASGNLGAWAELPSAGFVTHWGYPSAVVPRSTSSQLLVGPHWGHLKLGTVDHGTRALQGWSKSSDIGSDTGGDRPIVWSGGTTVKIGGSVFLYSFGGFEYACPSFACPHSVNEVFRARVLNTGSIDKWVKDTPLPDEPMTPTAVSTLVGGKPTIYLMGGSPICCDGRWPTDRILRTTVAPDGKLGPWVASGKLPYKASGIIAFARAGLLWVLGGSGDNWSPHDQVHQATIMSNGALGSWQAHKPLPGPAAGTPHGFIGDHFYVVGTSKGGKTAVYYAYFSP